MRRKHMRETGIQARLAATQSRRMAAPSAAAPSLLQGHQFHEDNSTTSSSTLALRSHEFEDADDDDDADDIDEEKDDDFDDVVYPDESRAQSFSADMDTLMRVSSISPEVHAIITRWLEESLKPGVSVFMSRTLGSFVVSMIPRVAQADAGLLDKVLQIVSAMWYYDRAGPRDHTAFLTSFAGIVKEGVHTRHYTVRLACVAFQNMLGGDTAAALLDAVWTHPANVPHLLQEVVRALPLAMPVGCKTQLVTSLCALAKPGCGAVLERLTFVLPTLVQLLSCAGGDFNDALAQVVVAQLRDIAAEGSVPVLRVLLDLGMVHHCVTALCVARNPSLYISFLAAYAGVVDDNSPIQWLIDAGILNVFQQMLEEHTLPPAVESSIAWTVSNMCASENAIIDQVVQNDFLVTWAVCVACDASQNTLVRIDAACIVCNMLCFSSARALYRLLSLEALEVLVAVFADVTLCAMPEQLEEVSERALSALDYLLHEHPPAIVDFVKLGGEKALQQFCVQARGTRQADVAATLLKEYMQPTRDSLFA